MPQAFAVIICFIASLSLVPMQDGFSTAEESDPEIEAQCCAAISQTEAQRLNVIPEISERRRKISVGRILFSPRPVRAMLYAAPISVLYCVLRE